MIEAPLLERSVLGDLFPTDYAEEFPSARRELRPYLKKDGSISFRDEAVDDCIVVPRPRRAGETRDERLLVPRRRSGPVVDRIIREFGEAVVGPPPQVRYMPVADRERRTIEPSPEFMNDPVAISVRDRRVTRLKVAERFGLQEAVYMLTKMFPQEPLAVFCTSNWQVRDLIACLRELGIFASDRDAKRSTVLVLRATNELANPPMGRHRRIILLSSESLTPPLARELSYVPDTSRVVTLSSMLTSQTQFDQERTELWFGDQIYRRYVAASPPRPIRGTFATLRQGKRRQQREAPTAHLALREQVIGNKQMHEAIGRLLNQEPVVWASRLRRFDEDTVLGMASPVIVVCATLQQALRQLAKTKRAVLASSAVGLAKQHAPTEKSRIHHLRRVTADADRVIVPLGDVHKLKSVGSIFRIDSLPGPLPLSTQQQERWGWDGDCSPLHIVDLHRVDFTLGRKNAASRAACYAPDLTPFAHAPTFKPHLMPPVHFQIGCGYGTKHVVYHRRPIAERGKTLLEGCTDD